MSVKELGAGSLLSAVLSQVGPEDWVSLLHKVVWGFFLHFLHQNFDWH